MKEFFTSRVTRHASRLTLWALLLPSSFFLLALSACSPATPNAAPTPNATAFIATRVVEVLTQNAMTDAAPRPTLPASETPTPVPASPTPVPSPTPTFGTLMPCEDQACATASEHFWLERPIPANYVNYADRSYPYGSTLNGQREPHHGVEFENAAGTPVIAAAPGTVIVAGDDAETAYGPKTNFYGNLVVVQLDQTYNGQSVLNLYAHLQTVIATLGQKVKPGDVLGTVGQTGVAIGPHLHFEVRVGKNDYLSSRNPELWLKPLMYNAKAWGAIAGRVMDTKGKWVDGYTVVIRPISVDYPEPRTRYVSTYARETLNGDDALQENFAIGDMPLGTYSVSVSTTKLYQQTVTVTEGHLAWVTFVVNPPAPPTISPTETP
jgi:murein DD-endopeptidase MepM/ murein hydrolase activator NlpD